MKIFLLVLSLLLSLSVNVMAQESATRQTHYNLSKDQLALEGYDPVSYFTEKKPQKGNNQYHHSYNGVIYQFKNESNKSEFIKNPTKYEPAYGGWCTYAMAKNGEKVSVNPLSYKISDGRLLLFYKSAFNNTLTSWNKSKTSESERLKKGDQYWKEIIKK